MYVCPHCKAALVAFACSQCGTQFSLQNGVASFLPAEGGDARQLVRDTYDDIYSHHKGAWTDQGRSQDFVDFFSNLVRSPLRSELRRGGS
jgi:hypothetical protein